MACNVSSFIAKQISFDLHLMEFEYVKQISKIPY